MSVAALPAGVDPLIAEAKERARRRRLLALAIVAGVAAAATVGFLELRSSPSAPSFTAPERPGISAAVHASIWNTGNSGGVTWAVNGRHLWITADLGRTWRAAPPELSRGVLNIPSVQFVDRSHGWAWSDGNGLDRTVDGGRTWTHVQLASTLAGFLFVSPLRGYAVAHNGSQLLATRDGGSTWQPVSGSRFRFGWPAWADARHGYVVSLHRVYATSDAGRTWDVVLRGRHDSAELWEPTVSGRDIEVPELLFVGDPDGPERVVVHTSRDGGKTWAATAVPGLIPGPLDHDAGLATVGFTVLAPADWIANTGRSVLVTRDAGRSWQRVRAVDLPRGGLLRGGGFTTLRVGWAILQYSPKPLHPMSVLVRTTDGGRHWTQAGPAKRR